MYEEWYLFHAFWTNLWRNFAFLLNGIFLCCKDWLFALIFQNICIEENRSVCHKCFCSQLAQQFTVLYTTRLHNSAYCQVSVTTLSSKELFSMMFTFLCATLLLLCMLFLPNIKNVVVCMNVLQHIHLSYCGCALL